MKLRYVELPPSRIFNRLGIENLTAWIQLGQKFGDNWWAPEVVELRNKFASVWINEFDKITGHFALLEESIGNSGIQHPISAISGPPRSQNLKQTGTDVRMFPPPNQTPLKEVIYTQPFGGSRVTLAKKLNITVPCAIHDFSNLFPTSPEITSSNFQEWFGNDYMFTSSLPHLRLVRQSHIKKSKYSAMNQHTRIAQQLASRVAREAVGL